MIVNNKIIVVLLCIGLFASCLSLYTQHNEFAFYAHHDEENKVEQILERTYNFNHPQLMLHVTDAVRLLRGQESGYQDITVTGRWVSASFAAISVVLIALMAWREFAIAGFLCIGLLVALTPIIGMTAHFLKEDTSLLLGVCAAMAGFLLYMEKPSNKRLILLGLLSGLAVSGKYIGVLSLIPAIIAVVVFTIRNEGLALLPSRLLRFSLPAGLVFVALNYPSLLDPAGFYSGFDNSQNLAITAQGRRLASIPNVEALAGLVDLALPLTLYVFAALAVILTLGPYRHSKLSWTLLGIGLLYTAVLIASPLGTPTRYLLLPVTALYALAGLGIVMVTEQLLNRLAHKRELLNLVAPLLALPVVALAWPTYVNTALDAFRDADSRAALIQWSNSHIDSQMKLAVEKRTRLPGIGDRELADPGIHFKQTPRHVKIEGSLNPSHIAELARSDITHLALQKKKLRYYNEKAGERLKTKRYSYGEVEVVWQTPKQFKKKNRWLAEDLVIVKLQ